MSNAARIENVNMTYQIFVFIFKLLILGTIYILGSSNVNIFYDLFYSKL